MLTCLPAQHRVGYLSLPVSERPLAVLPPPGTVLTLRRPALILPTLPSLLSQSSAIRL